MTDDTKKWLRNALMAAALVVAVLIISLLGIVRPIVDRLLSETVDARAKLEDANRQVARLRIELDKIDPEKLRAVLKTINDHPNAADILAKVDLGKAQKLIDLFGDRCRVAASGELCLEWGPASAHRQLCFARDGDLVVRINDETPPQWQTKTGGQIGRQ
jgi:hypothetical protein